MSGNILKIHEKDRTPIVNALEDRLNAAYDQIEAQGEIIVSLKEQIQTLRDEIASLKKTAKRPKFKNQNRKKGKNPTKKDEKRAGSEKRSKKKDLRIDEVQHVTPDGLPEGSKLKRRREVVVQNLVLESKNTKFILEEYISPDGKTYSATLPNGVAIGQFGVDLIRFVLYQHYHCGVTQPLIREMLIEIGVDISSGQINAILNDQVDMFHDEKKDILRVGLEVSKWVQTDDTGAPHDGQNGYCTHIGNDFFAWFESSNSKSRVNFLEILGSSFGGGYQITPIALSYMKDEKLPQKPLAILEQSIKTTFKNQEEWYCWLRDLGIVKKRHVKIATEAALLGAALENGLNPELIILSDDAGQFRVPMLFHALCWIHAIRNIKKLVPSTDKARKAQEDILERAWNLYSKLREYRKSPSETEADSIKRCFDDLFTSRTDYETLNQLLSRIQKNRKELLLVLSHPDIPLHNNGSEGDIREFVKKRKVSGGTRATSGRHSRDTFASLKKTCRKLATSFWDFLGDRLAGKGTIQPLASLIRKKAAEDIHDSPELKGAIAS